MAHMGNFDFSGMRQLQKELEKMQQNTDVFLEECAKELAARLLRKVVKRTPVGQYSEGAKKQGGTLRRGWTGNKRSSAQKYAESLAVRRFGGNYVVEVTNPVEYASYVEYGHRTVNHRGWVPGRFMMKISEQEIEQAAPQILERKIQKFMEGAFR